MENNLLFLKKKKIDSKLRNEIEGNSIATNE